ncbi:MAG: 30S ribosomal protein S3 [Candidatus Pacebacteria bacterium]|nr:30S ribosomal protein S3 [Candidatus Paceibacterota bacterium]MDD5069022.1 30S ribosomal protein S3 [Candidatus Paceibacterota bacterium]MDD5357257.1 30S ribosomal protein S3 [Candidatus Paceibacterota bacterium]
MTHIVHPYSHRLGIIRDWKSRWFSDGKGYRASLKVDVLLREYLAVKFRGMFVSGVDIERNQKTMRVIIKTSRPGVLIGRNGEGQVKLRNDILKQFARWGVKTKEELKIDVVEIRSPESNAAIVAQMVADSLEKRMPFRRVAKQIVEKVMANRDVLGVKVGLSGRLGGADMARREKIKKGRIPLQTFRADIDFAREKAHMSYGDIGIKVWIYKGEVFSDKKPAAK